MNKIELVIEKADDGFLGRVHYDDNLIIDEADSIEDLETSIKKVLKAFHGLKISEIEFTRSYDLSALFENFNFLKISTVARLAGVNASLLRQYVTGIKHPSASQAKKIEDILHLLGNNLRQVSVYA